ncbi:hypothetical protein BH09BAC5_BH09BAC5_10690 [soil metagenome]
MAKRKSEKNDISNKANEPLNEYKSGKVIFFNSFAEQEAYELEQMALLSPHQILLQLRKFINIAYGMHGFNPDKLPQKHTVRIIDSPDEHI